MYNIFMNNYLSYLMGADNISDKELTDLGIVIYETRESGSRKLQVPVSKIDADNLSKLDINHLKEKFLKGEWIKMYELWKEEFTNRMRTTKGKELYPSLLEKLKMSIDSELGS